MFLMMFTLETIIAAKNHMDSMLYMSSSISISANSSISSMSSKTASEVEQAILAVQGLSKVKYHHQFYV